MCLERNSLQFDYFSINYKIFEDDFYKFSNLNVPLIFLTADLLQHMSLTGHNYFRLNSKNAADKKDHYFIFKKVYINNNFISQFEYLGHICPIDFHKEFFIENKIIYCKKRSYIKWYSFFKYFNKKFIIYQLILL